MATRMTELLRRWWAVAIAVVFGGIWLAEGIASALDGNQAVGIVFAAAISTAFAIAGHHVLPAIAAVIALFALHSLVDAASLYSGAGSGLLAYAAVATIGALPGRRERLVGLGVVEGLAAVHALRVPERSLDGASRVEVVVSGAILFAVVWASAWAIASRLRATSRLRERAAALETEREAMTAAALVEERGRIARELHDVVAHSVSVMTVQAGGVRRLLRDDQDREREALESIEATGRKALAEMRRMVGVMRDTGLGQPALAPQPGLASLDRLVAEMRDAGLFVDLDVNGAGADLPPGVDLSAYRIVQESLTNVLKHAGPATARVTLRHDADGVDILVEDDGRGPRGGETPGHGLIGMRERVAVYGGTLETGPLPTGGFRVHARLPVER